MTRRPHRKKEAPKRTFVRVNREERQAIHFHALVQRIQDEVTAASYFLNHLPEASGIQPEARNVAARLRSAVQRVMEKLEEEKR